MTHTFSIRPFQTSDWDQVWSFMEPILRAGNTYTFAKDISKQEARHLWIELPQQTYVAVDENDQPIGTFYIKPNQPGQGAHVCNCGYMVNAKHSGKGVAAQMCAHSQEEARKSGFRAMQFNAVVSSNIRAVALWERMGFEKVGTLKGAFAHPEQGDIDSFVMYKRL